MRNSASECTWKGRSEGSRGQEGQIPEEVGLRWHMGFQSQCREESWVLTTGQPWAGYCLNVYSV